MTKSELKKAAKEMDTVMDGIDPHPPLAGTVAELQAWIKEACGQVQDDDEFTPETMAVMKELGFGTAPADLEAENEVADEVEETDEVAEECACPTAQAECKVQDDDWEEDNGKVLEAKIIGTKKLDALRLIVNEEPVFESLIDRLTEPEFNGMTGPKNLKAAMLKIISATTEQKPAKAPKAKKEKVVKEKAERFSRVDAAIMAIRQMNCPMTLSEIIDSANEVYSKETSTPLADPKHINNVPTLMVRTLNEFGFLKKENGKYSLC